MTKHLYYNQSSPTKDPRTGLGYGKSQKTPSFGTGQGSERSMGSAVTGIYTEPEEEVEEEDFGFDDDSDLDSFVKKINKKFVSPDPAFWPRADRGSLGQPQGIGWSALAGIGLGEAMIPVPKGQRLPKASAGIAPFPHRVLYPGGFDGPPLGSGGAGQAFKTTGPAFKTGTQYGSSRKPIDNTWEDEDIQRYSFLDVLNLDDDERAILKQKVRIMKLLNKLDEMEDKSDDAKVIAT